MSYVPGAIGTVAIRTSGLKYLNVDLDEGKLAVYGIPKIQALNAIAIGTGGKTITQTIQGRERYGIEIRFTRNQRAEIPDIKGLQLKGVNGQKVALSEVADIRVEDGPAVLQSEDGKLRSAVQMNVSGRDLVSFVEETGEYLKENLKENVNFSNLKEKSNLESARNSLFDERYNSSLKRIIDPLDIFVKVIEDRNNQVLETFKTKRVIIIVVSILLFLISSSFIFLLKRDNNTGRNNKSVT